MYVPQPPPNRNARPGRVAMPVVTRPSGLGGANVIRIVDMPRGGRLFIDGVEWMGGGHWDADEPNVWVVPNPPPGQVVRVDNGLGASRMRDLGRVVNFAEVESGELDWDSLTPVGGSDVYTDEAVGTGIVRVFGSPFAALIANGQLQRPFDGTNPPQYQLPAGETTLLFRAADGAEWRQNVNVRRGETVNVPVVRPAPPAPPRPPVGGGGPFIDTGTPPIAPGGGGGAAVANGTLTVMAEPGVVLAISRASAPTVLVAPPVVVPATGGVTTPWPAGMWVLGAARPNGQVQTRPVTVIGGQAQTVDMRTGWPAASPPPAGGGAGAGAGAGAGGGTPGATPSTTANVTVTGGVGWMLTVTNALGAMVGRLPILAGMNVVFPLPPGNYTLAVDDGAGHTAAQPIVVPAAGLAVDVTPWLASARAATQGPPAAANAVGTITLTGAPPGSLVRVSALSDFTVDDSGRPVLLSLPAGSHAVTVIPPGGAPQRTGAAVVTAGGNTPLAFGSLAALAAQTDGTGIETVPSIESQCGPVQSPAAWMPPTACPGNELVGPDGKRYRALAVEGGVAFMALKADGTVDTSWSTGTWVALGLAGAAAVGAAWWFYGRDGKSTKTENPGRGKRCSCQDHD